MTFVSELKALDWHSEPGFRWAGLTVPKPGKTGFSLLPPGTAGIHFTNVLDEAAGAANRVLFNGSGLAVGDFDNDGLPDVFFCSLSGTNALYKNLGDWHFKDVTAESGLGASLPMSRGAVFADINGDGFLDLLISVNGRGVICYTNDGHGKFTDATMTAGTSGKSGSTTMALADVNGDGFLDLYIANYRTDDIRDRGRVNVSMVKGKPVMAGTDTNRFIMLNGRLEECGQPDLLLLNDGAGHFKSVSWTDGTFLDESGRKLAEPPLDWGLTAMFRDVNDDMAPDLYVCNDYWTPDRFWINDGKGHFRAIPRLALRKISSSSMSVDFADIDRDGFLDFFTVDMLSRNPALRKREMLAQMPVATAVGAIEDRAQVMRNVLFHNRRDGSFAEIACYANLPASDWSWAPVFLDVDLDGYEDLVVGAGYFRDVQDYDAEALIRSRQHKWDGFKTEADRQQAFTRELLEHYHLYPPLEMPVVSFHNRGNCSFEETTEIWGLNHLGVHQGLAMADFDQDGDLDMVVNNLNAPAMLFRNDTAAGRVAVRLKGKSNNIQAIGAKVALLGGDLPTQSTEIVCGGRYQSGSDVQAVFATGAKKDGMTLLVRWRGGTLSRIDNVQTGRLYEIDEQSAKPNREEASKSAWTGQPLFEDASELIPHKHHETEFNDYERQPLLPFKLSQLGPGVAWFDLDGDGHDDLILGSGRGGSPSVFRYDGQERFIPAATNRTFFATNDTAGLVAWQDASGNRRLLAGLTGYEVKSESAAVSLRNTNGVIAQEIVFASEMTGAGALALGDMYGDGRLALFIAGGVSPGQYPMGAPSKIYRHDGRQWKIDAINSILLSNLGIVNGAVWSDLDGDGLPELVLACEWGPIRVFKNRGGALFDITAEIGLQAYTGWWRGVTTGDLNNDGKLDIIASNWGLNSPYHASAEKPLVFAFGQLSQPGVMDVIETEYAGGVLTPRRQFMALANSLPFLHEFFTSIKAYSEASLDQVLGDRMPLSRRVSVNTMASMVFINTGGKFKAVGLPREVQFAPAFSVNVADFNGDGNEDVFLSQNFFDLQPETARIDAGLSLWLQGDGSGNLKVVSAAESGIRVYGQARGAALCDYDEDGRIDLAVAQNGAATRLFHNKGASQGLRIKLKGPPGNPDGIGAVLRLQSGGQSGPAREVHAGSGYWSQDSLTMVMAMPSKPDALWVRWPGGRITTSPVAAGARDITVDANGKVATNR